MGSETWLNCSYDLEDDILYSIKWYKNGIEFYRFIPSDGPKEYKLNGIYLDMSKSNYSNVYLRDTDIFSGGTFRCEVSADAPSFQTVSKEKDIIIYREYNLA
ncbi:beat protein-like protein, partial [Leptotrombidium deliense]